MDKTQQLKKSFQIGKQAFLEGKAPTPEHDSNLVKYFFELNNDEKTKVRVKYQEAKAMWVQGYYFKMEHDKQKHKNPMKTFKINNTNKSIKVFCVGVLTTVLSVLFILDSLNVLIIGILLSLTLSIIHFNVMVWIENKPKNKPVRVSDSLKDSQKNQQFNEYMNDLRDKNYEQQ
ncbi:hypothetical protein HN014_22210 (plasmid) [Aquimarina sp. TRL1]|uniref:hypothetical protein n=1 Tax=Aquimarina sp. (strain TRL1) TaxID=2736252 RepID=UPI0015899D9F|nr:hypothetical protein [Aquimarina sp. TRL1]QKX07716.1 hypothetical protein HN014_22210 [Aquimarina sp. TRL1]